MHGSTGEWWLDAIRNTPRARQPVVLCLHDVTDRGWLDRFVGALCAAGEFIDLDTFMDRRERGAFTGREWVITLDDGERSLLDVVHPVLSAREVPYAAFIITDVMLGGPVPWFYRYQALQGRAPIPEIAGCWGSRYRRISSWTELTGLVIALPWGPLLEGLEAAEATAGVATVHAAEHFLDETEIAILSRSRVATIGAHTHHHPILANLSAEDQRLEVRQSVDHLTQVLGEQPRYFAYPSGRVTDFNEASVEAVRASGLRAAFTTIEQPFDGRSGVYRIPRIGVSDGMSLRRFAAKLAVPWYSRSARREMAYQAAYREST
mgnify:CR=1 FL=1